MAVHCRTGSRRTGGAGGGTVGVTGGGGVGLVGVVWLGVGGEGEVGPEGGAKGEVGVEFDVESDVAPYDAASQSASATVSTAIARHYAPCRMTLPRPMIAVRGMELVRRGRAETPRRSHGPHHCACRPCGFPQFRDERGFEDLDGALLHSRSLRPRVADRASRWRCHSSAQPESVAPPHAYDVANPVYEG